MKYINATTILTVIEIEFQMSAARFFRISSPLGCSEFFIFALNDRQMATKVEVIV